ncbi:MAG: cation diffusion facilitator family transporter [Planctomycetota bacterium]|jgi:cation diffusion facilitator family transporter
METTTPPLDPGAHKPESSEGVFALGMFGNLALAIVKLAVGWWAGSRALVADGWHSLSDLITNGGVWFAHRWAKVPADEDHHYGHGNAEPLAGLVVGVVLVVGGIGVVWSGLTSKAELRQGTALYVALGVAFLSMVVNVGLAWVTFREGKRLRSQGLLALARDNASDVLAAWLVVIGIVGASFGITWAESVAAVAIGLLVFWMGLSSARAGLDVLMDRTSDPELRGELRGLAEGIDLVRGVQSVRVHPIGSHNRVDMEISVDGDLTVTEGHEIAHRVEEAITTAHPSVSDVHVHVNPRESEETPASQG